MAYTGHMRIPGELLVLGATMRLTRFVVTDDLGRWTIRDKAYMWANSEEDPERPLWDTPPDPNKGWRSRLVSGLTCPFCVGFWIGVLVLLSYSLLGRTPVWRFVASALSLNEVAAHVGARLGDVNYDDDDEDQ